MKKATNSDQGGDPVRTIFQMNYTLFKSCRNNVNTEDRILPRLLQTQWLKVIALFPPIHPQT